MNRDPWYLHKLGELATLKNFLGAHYHQDVWDDFNSDKEVWNEYTESENIEGLELIIKQMEIVLQKSKEEIHRFIEDHQSGGLYLETAEESVEWLKRCRDYFAEELKKRQINPPDFFSFSS